MQLGVEFQILGIVLVIAGILLIIFGSIFLTKSPQEITSQRESKVVILIGPFPIVWGFGKRGKSIVIILFLVVITIWIVIFLL